MAKMNIRKVLAQVIQDLAANLNDYIASTQVEDENWFSPLNFLDEPPRVEVDRYMMGIYLSSPDGEVYASNGRTETVDVTLDCILDDERDNGSLPALYLSAVTDYLDRHTYGVSSMAYSAIAVRADLDAPVNAFAVALRVTLYDMDYDI